MKTIRYGLRISLALAMSAVTLQHALAYDFINPDTGPGCGLGKKLWGGWKGQKQIAPQLFMASTNMTGSYTFAITSGTSGCTSDGTVWDSQKASLFIEMNYANLEVDMARGGGEHLASLATLLNLSAEDQPRFFSSVQARYVSFAGAREDAPAAIREVILGAVTGEPSQPAAR